MKLVMLAAAAVLSVGAVPALAAPYDYDADTGVVATPPADVQAADQARQDYYQNKLDAAQAQTQADDAAAQAQARANDAMAKADQALSERDQALADRDAAEDRAYGDRDPGYDSRVIYQDDDFYP